MTRILVTYHGLAERRLAAHRGLELTRRGLDVDLASEEIAKVVPDDIYDRVVMAPDLQVGGFAATAAGGEGALRIIGADRRPPEPPPVFGLHFAPRRPPSPPRRLASLWPPIAGILTAFALAFAARGAGAPPYATLILGVVTVGVATHLFRSLAAPRSGARSLPSTVVAPAAPGGRRLA